MVIESPEEQLASGAQRFRPCKSAEGGVCTEAGGWVDVLVVRTCRLIY